MIPTPKKKILILRNNLAINAGVQSLLLEEHDTLEVFGNDFHDQDEIFQSITHLQPNVIVVDEEFLTAHLAALLTFLQSYPKTRTVIMSLRENQVQVYDTKQIPIQQIGDFIAVLYFPGSEQKN